MLTFVLSHVLASTEARFFAVASASCFFAWMSRGGLNYARPFGIADSESLMNFSHMGSLRCHCEPTNPAKSTSDRRQSCRACGSAIFNNDPSRLYQKLTRGNIQHITRSLQRAGIDARGLADLTGAVGATEITAYRAPYL